jgi:WD40 repeat protein
MPLFCSGGWDTTLLVWRADGGEAPAAPQPKRAKKAAQAAPPLQLEPVARLSGHTDVVSSVVWPTAALAYSTSWDGAIREWDIEAERCTTTLATQRAAVAVDVSMGASTIATGHCDHLVRVWDARMQTSAPALTLQHKAWVSGVAWSPCQTTLLASSCYDGTVRLWDTRSTVPLHDLPPHGDKALCVAWDGAEQLVSGGADGQLRRAEVAAGM